MSSLSSGFIECDLEIAIARHPLTIEANAMVSDAIALMNRMNRDEFQSDSARLIDWIGCVWVVEADRIVGLLTDRDLVQLLATPHPLDRLRVYQVMTQPVVTQRESDCIPGNLATVLAIVQQFQTHSVQYMPLVDDGDRLIGVIVKEKLVSLLGELLERSQTATQPVEQSNSIDAQLKAQNQLLTQIAQGKPCTQILHDIIIQIENFIAESIGSVLLVGESNRLYHGAAPHLPEGYSQQINGHVAVADGEGSCGTAAFRATPVIVADIAHHPHWNAYRDIALTYGLRACWSTPITASDGQVLGTFALYFLQVRSPQPSEMELLNRMANLAGIAIERNRVENHLRQSEANNQALLSAMPDLLLRVGRDGSCGAFVRPSDGHPGTFLPIEKHVGEVLPPPLLEYQLQRIEIALSTGQLQVWEHEFLKHGVPSVEEVRLTPCGTDECLVIVRDITQRKQAERELRQREEQLRISEAQYRRIIETAQEGIWVIDAENRTTFVNSRMAEMLGYVPEEMLGQFLFNFMDEQSASITIHNIKQRQQGLREQYDFKFQHKDGSDVWTIVLCNPIFDEAGHYIGALAMVVDIGDRRRVEQQLQSLIEGTAATTGQDFFPALVSHIGQSLEVSHVLVTERSEDNLQTLAFWANGALQHNISYPLVQTPCEMSLQSGTFYCETLVQQQFPEDISLKEMQVDSYLGIAFYDTQGQALGNLCILDTRPIQDPERIENLLKVFAARAAAELERQRAMTLLEQLNHNLEARIAERTRELWQVNALQRALLDGSDYSIISTDLEGKIQTFNAGAERMLGYSAAEVVGKATPELFHDRQEVIDFAASLSQQLGRSITPGFEALTTNAICGIQNEEEWTHIRKDGSKFPVSLSISALKDEHQQIFGFLGIGKDITKRKQIEVALRESEERWQLAISGSNDGIWDWDMRNNKMFFSERWKTMRGFSDDEISDDPQECLSRVHPDDFDRVSEAVHDHCAGRTEFFEAEYRVRRKDGSYMWVLDRAKALRNESGEVVRLSGSESDISKRKAAESERDRLLSFLNASLNEIYVFDAVSLRLVYVNQGAINNLGYSLDRLKLMNPLDFKIDFSETEFRQLLQPLLSRQQTILTFETRHQRADGSCYPVEVHTQRHEYLGDTFFLAVVLDISDRKRTEAEILQLKERLQFVLSSSPAIIYSCKPEGDFGTTFVSDNLEAIMGYTPDQMLAESAFWIDRVHPDDRFYAINNLEELFGCDKHSHEYRFLHRDGTYRWVRDEMRLVRNSQGNPAEIVGYFADISDRKQTELALQESQRFIQQIADASPNILYLYDLEENRNVYVNREIATILGYSPEEIKEMGSAMLAKLMHPDDLLILPDLIEQLHQMKDGETLEIEYRMRHADGHWCWLNGRDTVFSRTADGRVKQTIGTAQDISDRKIAEQQLQDSEAKLQAILNFASSVIYVKDLEGRHIFVNQAFLDLFCCEMEDIIGKTIDEFFPPAIAEVMQANDRVILESGTVCQFEETVWLDGVFHTYLSNKFLLRDVSGNPYAICGMSTDITDRKVTEQLIQQQAERESLLRQITQRIRQSLDLQTIFNIACQEIRQVIQADRVGIFKFYPESNFDEGEFVAESVVEGCSSVVAERVRDHCFGKNYSSLYAQGQFYAVDDIYAGGLEHCHNDILRQFGIRANLVMPLLCGNHLWGLLCVHQCTQTHHWETAETNLVQQIANQLAIAIQQASLYDQIQSELRVRQRAEAEIAVQLRRQETLGAIAQQIRQSLDISEILATVAQQVKDLLQGDRVIVFQLFPDGRSQIVEEAVSPEFAALKDLHWEDETWSQEILDHYWQGTPRIVSDVMNDVWTECLMEYSIQGNIQSKIVAPILQEVHGSENHRWVAPWQTNKLWGVLVVHACQEKRHWQESEAQLVQQIANQLAIAIQQASLFDQLQQELSERQQAQLHLTERNQQLAISNYELARATRLKDEFLANMSHELRTPLNAILGMTEGLQEQVFGCINDQQLKALKTIERSGSHLLELINDVLDVAKIEAGQIELELTSTAITPLCQSSLSFVKQQAHKKQIRMEINLAPNLPNLLIDERRIRQVLINLLNNAVKFTPNGGHITLDVTRHFEIAASALPHSPLQHYLRISISDTGIGIAPENISKLFQPFVQIDSALNRTYDGTGLGLALVRRIVELHRGRVSVVSKPGEGSCFIVDLPYTFSCTSTNASSSLSCTEDNLGQFSQTSSPLILLAEDNEANINTLSSYLGAKGYRTVLAQDGREAIALASSAQPDLIIMDIQMPVMDGLEAIQQIRRDRTLSHIPIIALTALAMPGDRERCLAAGATDYLSKPVKLKQFVTTIEQLLASRENAP